jgi:hypothetical protein
MPLRYDGRQLQRLVTLMDHYGTRLGVKVIEGRRVLYFREPVGDEAIQIAARHHGLLMSAWAVHPRRIIKCCGHCMAPFVTIRSNDSKCPVCSTGKRTVVVDVPFEALEERRAS